MSDNFIKVDGKILPPALSCLHAGRILDYYKASFDAVFIVLHPLFINHTKIDFNNYKHPWPSKENIQEFKMVSWADLISTGVFRNIYEIDLAHKTLDHCINKKNYRLDLSDKLLHLLNELHYYPALLGDMPKHLENPILTALQKIGCPKIKIYDEFLNKPVQQVSIEEACADSLIPSHGHIGPEKGRDFLITTHWDSHFSFICGSRDFIDNFLTICPLEGFFCREETEVYWSLYAENLELTHYYR